MKTNNRNSILTETEELFTNESQIIESFNSNCTIVDSNSDFHDKLHVYKSPIIDITKYFSPTVESQMDLELIILNEYYLKHINTTKNNRMMRMRMRMMRTTS